MDAERAHVTALKMAGRVARSPELCQLAAALYAPAPSPRLRMQAFGLTFDNPVGLAAGLDKDGEAIDLWAALGFGFVELGTVTPGHGQPGNEPPRLTRVVEDRAIVNRMGFNNRGAPHLAGRLAARRTRIPCGANLGKAKVTPLDEAPDDYEATLRAVWPHADYIVINVSSPNTPGLRDLQAVAALEPLVARVVGTNRALAAEHGRNVPVLLKIAPDLADSDVDAVAELAVASGLDGIVATNTTLRHDLLSRSAGIEGGVSGVPLAPRALELTRRLYRRLEGRLPIVGVGGIRSAEDAWRRIRAGATLVQVYTGLIYEGPGLIASIVEGLDQRLRESRYDGLADVVGVDA
ncbi:MAG: quinone-dependent dihydroorotate dehydrogenase [Deltaproteobacteria bacterium]|nr:quinone-dependent dihydroorotate dehydrogenase [Deltaproteobacteria bacterium]